MPRIYVASLSDYNAGRYVGDWVELDEHTDVEDVRLAIAEILASSPMEGAEEFAIHDHEGFGGIEIGEWEPIERLVFLAEMIAEFGATAVGVFVNYVVGDHTPFTADDIREAYRGEFASETEFAQLLLIDVGLGYRGVGSEELGELVSIIDWDAVVSELSDDYQFVRRGPDVLVFERNIGG